MHHAPQVHVAARYATPNLQLTSNAAEPILPLVGYLADNNPALHQICTEHQKTPTIDSMQKRASSLCGYTAEELFK
jgi:hypothetical protein